MEYIIVTIIALGITAYICYPFFTRSGGDSLFEEDKKDYTERRKSDLELLEENKLELYSAIKEIEFDYGLGKLSEEDYKELRQNYVYEAAKVVSKIEELSAKDNMNLRGKIEDEIKSYKQRTSSAGDELEQEIKKHRKKKD